MNIKKRKHSSENILKNIWTTWSDRSYLLNSCVFYAKYLTPYMKVKYPSLCGMSQLLCEVSCPEKSLRVSLTHWLPYICTSSNLQNYNKMCITYVCWDITWYHINKIITLNTNFKCFNENVNYSDLTITCYVCIKWSLCLTNPHN